MSFVSYNPVDLSSFRSPSNLRHGSVKNPNNDEQDLYTLGSKDIEVNQGSPIDNYTKESPMNRYFNTLRKDPKNEDTSLDSEGKFRKKEQLDKDLSIPKFPDLSIAKGEDENFEMNSKDFLENNRILRHELMRNNSFFKKHLNNDFKKEIYDSINEENSEKNESYRAPANQRKKDNSPNLEERNPDRNFLFFESFNDHIPKITVHNCSKTPPQKLPEKSNFYVPNEVPKSTPEFLKFQPRISMNSFDFEGNQTKNNDSANFLDLSETQKMNGSRQKSQKNYDLPLKCSDKESEALLKLFNNNSKNNRSLDSKDRSRKSTEIFDEGIDENISKDLKSQIADHFLLKKEHSTRFNRCKVPETAMTCPLDDMISFKNTNSSSILNQNSDRLKSSPIISIHIHESIKKDAKHEKKSQNSEFKFLEDYRLECAKNPQLKLQNEIANKNSTTLGLSSVEYTDNNSEKPVYVLNMEIISSNCLSPIVKEKIINFIKSNSNYAGNSIESFKQTTPNRETSNPEKTQKNNTEKEEKENNLKENLTETFNENNPKFIQALQKTVKSGPLYSRKFSLSNLKNMGQEEIFSNKKTRSPGEFISLAKKPLKEVLLEMNTPQSQARINNFNKYTNLEEKQSKSKSKSRSQSKIKENNTNKISLNPKKTHYKNYSNPNIFQKSPDDASLKREKNTSFHTRNEQQAANKHDVSTNIAAGNTYLPHVKTKQTILEYELFRKQKKRENGIFNTFLEKKQLNNLLNKKTNGKSEKKLQNKSLFIENKENIHEKINEAATRNQNNPARLMVKAGYFQSRKEISLVSDHKDIIFK